MSLALKLAENCGTKGQTPFGAVVVGRDGRLVGEGHNSVRTDLDPTAHGEIVAIRDAWRRLGAWQCWQAARSIAAASRACFAPLSSRRSASAAWFSPLVGRTYPAINRCSR